MIEDGLGLLNADDVGQAAGLGWADEAGHLPGLTQHVQGEEFEAVQIELDAAPGVLGLHLGEVVGELRRAEGTDFKVKVRTDAAHGARISIDRRGLQAFELEVLQVGSVQSGEGLGEIGGTDAAWVGKHGQTPRRLKARIPYHQGMRQHLTESLRLLQFFLRVAASSNPAVNLAPFGRWTLLDKAAQRR